MISKIDLKCLQEDAKACSWVLRSCARASDFSAHSTLPQTPWRKSKWGLSEWGLKALVHDCPRLPKFPLHLCSKWPQKRASVDDRAQIADSGLKPPFESPHLDFPEHLSPEHLCTMWLIQLLY